MKPNPTPNRATLAALALPAMIATAPAGVVVDAYYPLGEPGSLSTENLALDSSGNGHHFFAGSHSIAFQVQASVPTGVGSTASLHDNSGPSMYVAAGGSITDNFTVDIWTKTGSPGQTADVFEGNALTQGSLRFSLLNGAWEASYENNTVIGTPATAVADEWIRLTVIRHAGSSTFYVNGIQSGLATSQAPSNPALNYSGFHLGINSGGAINFQGNYDELRIWTFDPGTDSLESVKSAVFATDPYLIWSGSADFHDDTNGDGIKNGLAFLLGAANKNVSALALLPGVTRNSGDLVLTFNCRKDANRGSALLKVQHSRDLGMSDPWISAPVSDAPVSPFNSVTFSIQAGVGATNRVTATISASEAESTGKLFGRLEGVE